MIILVFSIIIINNISKYNGAYISSNSWGSYTEKEYTDSCYEIDEYIYNENDFNILFATGNYDNDYTRKLPNEARCKNSISVGSSLQSDSGDIYGMYKYY